MANPTFNSFSLQNETYLTRSVQYRTTAPRSLESRNIARRLGQRFINEQIQAKVITIEGLILSDTEDALKTAVDNLQKALNTPEKALIIEDGRTYTATKKTLEIPETHFTKTVAPFTAEFVVAKAFAEGNQQLVSFLIPSGTNTLTVTTTLSGTVENRPTLTLVLPSGTGTSPIIQVDAQNQETANKLTVSGAFNAEGDIVFDYDNFNVTVEGSSNDYSGQFDSFNPGDITLIITVSGQNDGIRGNLSYNPRFW